MNVVKLKGKGQMTLPVSIREQLLLDEGALLEASIEDGRIVLTPKMLVDRASAFDRLEAIGKRSRAKRQHAGLSDEALDSLIGEAVQDVRSKHQP